MRNFILILLFLAFGITLPGCSSDSVKDATDAIDDAIDGADIGLDPPSRKPIDRSYIGVNAFFNISELGSITEQYAEVRSTLRLNYARVLFAWTDGVQPTPDSPANYSFYDEIVDGVPNGVDILVTVAHTPTWMTDSANWIDGDPIKTWVERWLKPTVSRYAGRRVIIGWQVFNEPDNLLVASDISLNLSSPENYLKMLKLSSAAIRNIDPTSLVVLAATRSIQQASGANLNYNKTLKTGGAEELVDIWAAHYYGKQFEKVVNSGGVADFLNSLSVPIWITESGEMGQDKQLGFAETTWPFLLEKIPNIQRIYYYQLNDRDSTATTFALRTPEGVSDLYVRLRDGQ